MTPWQTRAMLYWLQHVDRKLDLILRTLNVEQEAMARSARDTQDRLNQILGAAANERTQFDSFMAMFDKMKEQVKELTSGQVDDDTSKAIDDVFDAVTTNDQHVTAAVVANTPQAAPATAQVPGQQTPPAAVQPGTVDVTAGPGGQTAVPPDQLQPLSPTGAPGGPPAQNTPIDSPTGVPVGTGQPGSPATAPITPGLTPPDQIGETGPAAPPAGEPVPGTPGGTPTVPADNAAAPTASPTGQPGTPGTPPDQQPPATPTRSVPRR